jgi:hypothetical protein
MMARSKIWRPTGKKYVQTSTISTVPSQKFTKEFCTPECSNSSELYVTESFFFQGKGILKFP